MLIRILLCLLSIYACETHQLDSRIEDKQESANTPPPPTTSIDQTADPTSIDQTVNPASKAECLKTCDVACEDWTDWTAFSPLTNTVCTGEKLTQSQNRTRTCKATCAGVQCLTTENNEKEVGGTMSCPEPPPPCKTTCNAGCKDWKGWTDWLPAVETECKGVNFTQTRTQARECYDTCDDRADCLCSVIQCQTTTSESQTATGSKVINCQTACDSYTYSEWSPQASASEMCVGQSREQTRTGTRNCPRDDCSTCQTTMTETRTLQGTLVTPCQAENSSYCNSWQAVSGDDGDWSPARNTVLQGESFQQTREERRTCPSACSNSSCKLTRTNIRSVTGTKPPTRDSTGTNPSLDQAPTLDQAQTCAEGCGDWNLDNWQWTLATDECPDPALLTKPTLVEEKATRSKTRECDNLKEGLRCFTVKNETQITRCKWCQRDGYRINSSKECVQKSMAASNKESDEDEDNDDEITCGEYYDKHKGDLQSKDALCNSIGQAVGEIRVGLGFSSTTRAKARGDFIYKGGNKQETEFVDSRSIGYGFDHRPDRLIDKEEYFRRSFLIRCCAGKGCNAITNDYNNMPRKQRYNTFRERCEGATNTRWSPESHHYDTSRFSDGEIDKKWWWDSPIKSFHISRDNESNRRNLANGPCKCTNTGYYYNYHRCSCWPIEKGN